MTTNVLIASNETNLELVTGLKQGSYALVLKTRGSDALAYLREHTPDVAVIDVDLADISGIDLCYRIKKVSRLKQVPVLLLLPARDAQRLQLAASMAKADGVLALPASKYELRDAVEGLLSGKGAAAA